MKYICKKFPLNLVTDYDTDGGFLSSTIFAAATLHRSHLGETDESFGMWSFIVLYLLFKNGRQFSVVVVLWTSEREVDGSDPSSDRANFFRQQTLEVWFV